MYWYMYEGGQTHFKKDKYREVKKHIDIDINDVDYQNAYFEYVVDLTHFQIILISFDSNINTMRFGYF